eukprot:5218015-Pyramimonas_sp.AAC.1
MPAWQSSAREEERGHLPFTTRTQHHSRMVGKRHASPASGIRIRIRIPERGAAPAGGWGKVRRGAWESARLPGPPPIPS